MSENKVCDWKVREDSFPSKENSAGSQRDNCINTFKTQGTSLKREQKETRESAVKLSSGHSVTVAKDWPCHHSVMYGGGAHEASLSLGNCGQLVFAGGVGVISLLSHREVSHSLANNCWAMIMQSSMIKHRGGKTWIGGGTCWEEGGGGRG